MIFHFTFQHASLLGKLIDTVHELGNRFPQRYYEVNPNLTQVVPLITLRWRAQQLVQIILIPAVVVLLIMWPVMAAVRRQCQEQAMFEEAQQLEFDTVRNATCFSERGQGSYSGGSFWLRRRSRQSLQSGLAQDPAWR